MARHEEMGFESEEDLEAYEAEQEEHSEEIRNLVLDYMEENEVAEPTAIFTLLQLAISLHMSGYMTATEKPSVAGLKIELDRLGTDIADMIRDSKKGAQDFIDAYRNAVDDEEN